MIETIGKITQLTNVKRILNLEDDEIHGKVDIDKIRSWWKDSQTVGSITQKVYRTLDEFEEFIKELEGIE